MLLDQQPENAAEPNQAIKLFQTQELGCHRYSGSDPAVLQKLPAEDCDHFRPDLKLNRDPDFASFGPAPTFALSIGGTQCIQQNVAKVATQVAGNRRSVNCQLPVSSENRTSAPSPFAVDSTSTVTYQAIKWIIFRWPTRGRSLPHPLLRENTHPITH